MKKLTQKEARQKCFNAWPKQYSSGIWDILSFEKTQKYATFICEDHGTYKQKLCSQIRYSCKKCNREIKGIQYKQHFLNNAPKYFEYINLPFSLKHYDYVYYKCIECNRIGKKTAENILQGNGCVYCWEKIRENNMRCSESRKKATETINKTKRKKYEKDFLFRAHKMHNKNRYTYSEIPKNCLNKINIICNECGYIFSQRPYQHLTGSGCSKCKESKGEKEVRKILENYNIPFIPQYRFNDCKLQLPLPFDFYLSEYNLCIEYHGEQHYRPVNWNNKMTKEELKEQFKKTQLKDNIKKEYCINNNISLLIIQYWNKNKIEDILTRRLKLVSKLHTDNPLQDNV